MIYRDHHALSSTLVILDDTDASRASDWARRVPRPAKVTLLSLCGNSALLEVVKQRLATPGFDVDVRDAAGILDQVAPGVRDKYVQLVADVGDRCLIRGRTLKKAFTFEGRLSLWWLNEISSKRSDAYATFTRLCQLEVIRRTVGSTKPEVITLLTSDARFWDVVSSYCRVSGIPLESKRPEGLSMSRLRSTAAGVRILLGMVPWIFRAAAQTALAKLLAKADVAAGTTDHPTCAFYTQYPNLWVSAQGERDEKYQRVPDLVQQLGGIPATYACSFATDDVHQRIPLRRYYQLCRWLHARSQKNPAVQMHLMDRDLRWVDLCRGLGGVSIAVKYLWLGNQEEFRRQWTMDGVDIYPLIKAELRFAALRTPRYIVHLLRTRSYLNRVNPGCFVISVFELCLGRALVYAAKTAIKPPLVIGTQHGMIAKRRLVCVFAPGELIGDPTRQDSFVENVPIPDHILLEGEGARRVMLESGYPPARLHVLGAPRVGRLASVQRKSRRGLDSSPATAKVLVAFGQHDGKHVLEVCKPILETYPGYHFVFKVHPRSSVTARVAEEFLKGCRAGSTYEVASGDFYRLLERADAVIATYSSTGLEAAALGYPVVCIHLSNFASPTGLLDFESGVKWAASSQELVRSLQEVLLHPPKAEDAERVEQFFFGSLDGQADRRWAEAIVGLMTGRDAAVVGERG